MCNTKFIFFIVLLTIIVSPIIFYASTGVGIIIGEPTGISLKFNDFPILGIAWSFNNYFHIHVDYWLRNSVLNDPLNWFIGLGGKLLIYDNDSNNKKKKDDNDSIGLGFRVPVGLQVFALKELEIFGEIVPGILLIPSTKFDIDAGIGVRYHFQ